MSPKHVTTAYLFISVTAAILAVFALVFDFVEGVKQRALVTAALQSEIEAMRPPVVVHAHKAMKGRARPGEMVSFEVDRTATRHCPGLVFEVWHNNGHTIRRDARPVAAKGRGFLGRRTISIPVQVPDEPGSWCYEPTVLWKCPGLDIPVRVPSACIEVQ